jgi:two-component sensor histidine kinase
MMRTLNTILLTLIFLLISTSPASNENNNPVEGAFLTTWQYHAGDSLIWADPNYQDSHWITINANSPPLNHHGIHWLRKKIELFIIPDAEHILYLHIANLQSAYEVFWDGNLIAHNGTVGNAKSPGRIYFSKAINATLTSAGEHQLAIRLSNENGSLRYNNFQTWIGYSPERPFFGNSYYMRNLLYIGICLTGTFIGLALFLGGGIFRPYLFYIFICLPLVISRGIQFCLYYLNLPSIYRDDSMFVFLNGLSLIQISIPVFFIIIFNIPYRIFHITAICLIVLISRILDIPVYRNVEFYVWLQIPYVLGIIIYAIYHRKNGSVIALIAILIYHHTEFFNLFGILLPTIYWDLSYWLFILTMIFVVSKQVQRQSEIQRSAELHSQRLETELLKKTIQPHFIMNSLSSVKSWARTDPVKADKLVQAIASEFRILSKITSEKNIPISQEIELCEYHLEVMGYRRDAKYTLVKENIPEDEKIPPLIFHTLIENGITHAFKPKENGTFWLTADKNDQSIEYCLRNNGSLLTSFLPAEIKVGMGIQYVKARLTEIYHDRWKLSYGPANGLWEVKITISKKGK